MTLAGFRPNQQSLQEVRQALQRLALIVEQLQQQAGGLFAWTISEVQYASGYEASFGELVQVDAYEAGGFGYFGVMLPLITPEAIGQSVMVVNISAGLRRVGVGTQSGNTVNGYPAPPEGYYFTFGGPGQGRLHWRMAFASDGVDNWQTWGEYYQWGLAG